MDHIIMLHTLAQNVKKNPFVSRHKFGEAISKESLAEVSGGGTNVKVPEEFYEQVTKNCRMCGKEFTRKEYTGPINMLPHDPFKASWDYYQRLCDDCAKKYPYIY